MRDKIKVILESRDMRPADLARAANVSQGLLSDLLNGRRDGLSLETVKRISNLTMVNITE